MNLSEVPTDYYLVLIRHSFFFFPKYFALEDGWQCFNLAVVLVVFLFIFFFFIEIKHLKLPVCKERFNFKCLRIKLNYKAYLYKDVDIKLMRETVHEIV